MEKEKFKPAYIFSFGIAILLILLTAGVLYGIYIDGQKMRDLRQTKPIRLFTEEGCTVYRFYDKETGYFVYYSNCKGHTLTMHRESKNTKLGLTMTATD